MNSSESKLFSQLKKEDTIAIISHINPDGDSIGSVLALGMGLRNKSKNVYMYINDDIPQKYKFLQGIQNLILYDEANCPRIDYCFVLDCGDIARLGYSRAILNNSSTIINIDHHVTNTRFADINILDQRASSTSEIIFNLLEKSKIPINKNIAQALYTGIATDTGNFVYDNTSSKTHKIVSKLLDYGVDLNLISYNLYQNKDLNLVRYTGYILQNLKLYYNGKLAIILAFEKDLKEYRIHDGDVDGIINYARNIQGVKVAILIKEIEDDKLKISFRSKDNIDVSKLAKEFEGGGHAKASGATIRGNIRETSDKIISKVGSRFGWR